MEHINLPAKSIMQIGRRMLVVDVLYMSFVVLYFSVAYSLSMGSGDVVEIESAVYGLVTVFAVIVA